MTAPTPHRKLLVGGGWALGNKIAASLVFLALGAILARVLSPAALGTYFLAGSLVRFWASIGDGGVGRAATRRIAEHMAHPREGPAADSARMAVVLGAAWSSLTAIVVIVGGRAMALRLFDNPDLAGITTLVAVWVIVLSLQRVLSDVFRGYHDIRLATMLGYTGEGFLSGSFLLAAIFLLRALGRESLQSVTAATVVAIGCSIVIGLLLLRFRLKGATDGGRESGLPGRRRWLGEARSLVVIGGPVMLSVVLNYTMSTQMDLWIAGATMRPEDLALYGAAARLIIVVAFPLIIVNSVVPPIIAELHAKGRIRELEALVRSAVGAAGIPAIAVLTGFMVGGGFVIGLVYGEFYEGATVVLVILSVGQLANVLAGPAGQTLAMTGRELWLLGCSALVGLGMLYPRVLAARAFGLEGLAAVSASALILQNIVLVALVRWKGGWWTVASFSPKRIGAFLDSLAGR